MHPSEVRITDGIIWGRVLKADRPKLSPQTAKFILELGFGQKDKERMRELAAKARNGTLLSDEQEEVDAYGRVGSVLAILKSKARQALKKGRSNGSSR